MAGPVDVFLSYAQEDDALRAELEEHLARLKRDGVIRTWSQRCLVAGDRSNEEVEERLAGAKVVLLLVSASYLASDYLYEVQAMTALAWSRAGKVRVIPVLLHACDWEIAVFEGLTPLPPGKRPVSSWPNRHEAWAAVARGIRGAIAGAAASFVAPEPAYESAEIGTLSEQMERARARREELAKAGASTAEIDEEILQMRRRLREGGQLRAGDALGDGRYLLLYRLGKGGFGSVWAALDRKGDEQVAIKVMHPSEAREALRRERFFRGARVMGSLRHEAVVRVLDPHGEDGGYLYFVMELVAGRDLHRAVTEKRLLAEEVIPLILRVAEALGEAHAQGIVHRDVKPSNIVLDASGKPKLTDFDLVAAKDTTGGTRTGALGTFLYAAPEQLVNAQEADARADVFGLGMTAVFCLYGKELPALMPYKREEVIAGLSCPLEIKTVVTRAIALEPEKRYADARAFGEALQWAARVSGWAVPRRKLPAPRKAAPPQVEERGNVDDIMNLDSAPTLVLPPLLVPAGPSVLPPPPLPAPNAPSRTSRIRVGVLALMALVGGFALVGGVVTVWQILAAPPTPAPSAPEATDTPKPADTAGTTASTAATPIVAAVAIPANRSEKTPEKPEGGNGRDIDRVALSAAFSQAIGVARGCKKEDGPMGTARVKVTFAPSGTVTSSSVDGAPFAGTAVGNCIAAAFRGIKVPAFEGAPVIVTKSVIIN